MARNVRGCCMAYGTAKAEIVAGLVGQASAIDAGDFLRRDGA